MSSDSASEKAPDAFRTISEVAEMLELPQHVLRFWETRFSQIKPMKGGGGRRYYRPEDVQLLRGIRTLLYAEGFTIRGVQRLLKEKGVAYVGAMGEGGSAQPASLALEDDASSDPRASDAEPEEQIGAEGRETAQDAGDELAPPRDDTARADLPKPAAGAVFIPPEGVRRVEAALAALVEAKRLLDQVR